MSDERALLAAICAHPEEDTPRLAYADWLDEHAGVIPKPKRASVRRRAELIRVQCELFRLPPDDEDADTAMRRAALENRQAELATYRAMMMWAEPLGRLIGYGGLWASRDSFVRGFPKFAGGAGADFLNEGEALFELSPVHIIMCSSIWGETADPFLAQKWLTRARRMSIATNRDERLGSLDAFGAADVMATEKLFAAQALAALEELTLSHWEFGPPGSPLAGRALSSLRSLTLRHGTSRGPQTFVRLGELLPSEARLSEFLLAEMPYDADDLRTFADLPQVRRLERLTLGPSGDYSHRPERVRAVTSAPFWSHLRAFGDRQEDSGFTPEEVEKLAAAPPAPNLRTLNLGSVGLGIGTLAGSAVLGSITKLELSRANLIAGSVLALAKSPHLNRLLNLQLCNCRIGPGDVKALAEAPWAANLVRLNLSRNSIKKVGIEALVSPHTFPRLRYLDVIGSVRTHADQDRLRAKFGDGVRF